MATKLLPDFKEFLQLLEENAIDYLLVGGYAVGLYGYARATVDMDIWVRRDVATSKKIFRLLEQFGFPTADLTAAEFTEPEAVFQMGVPPFRLDLLTSISGVEFDAAFHRRRRLKLDGIEINVISLADLRVNKLATGRLQDLNDVKKLERNTKD
jgi:predicted nucleotidyltransferase